EACRDEGQLFEEAVGVEHDGGRRESRSGIALGAALNAQTLGRCSPKQPLSKTAGAARLNRLFALRRRRTPEKECRRGSCSKVADSSTQGGRSWVLVWSRSKPWSRKSRRGSRARRRSSSRSTAAWTSST